MSLDDVSQSIKDYGDMMDRIGHEPLAARPKEQASQPPEAQMTGCEHKNLVLTSQRGTDGLPIYSCGVPLAVRELIEKWRESAENWPNERDIDKGFRQALFNVANQLEAAMPSGCGALFKVKPEEITVEVPRELGACDICGANGGECIHTNRALAAATPTQPQEESQSEKCGWCQKTWDKCTCKDPVQCGCKEFPECTHALYWYQGYKQGKSEHAVAPPRDEVRGLVEAVARDAVQLAIVRNSLSWDNAEELTEEQIAQDAADAIYGDGTCADGEPLESVKKLEAALAATTTSTQPCSGNPCVHNCKGGFCQCPCHW